MKSTLQRRRDDLATGRARGESGGPAAELPTLLQAWERAIDGRGAVLTLEGEAGLGKTLLVDALATSVLAGGGRAVVLRCSAFHRHSPLHAVARLLAERAGLDADAPSRDAAERITALLARDGVGVEGALPLVAALVAPGSPSAAPAAAMPPAELMRATQTLLVEWVTRMAREHALLMVWEDVHWADPSTLGLLRELVKVPPEDRLLTVLTLRSGFNLPWPADTLGATLRLERWAHDAVRQLVRDVAGADTLVPALVDRIARAADGVPLHAVEITRGIVDSPSPGPGARPLDVPPTLLATTLGRLDRLAHGRALAQTAALLGPRFSFELLAAASELPADRVAQGLGELVDTELLCRVGPPAQPLYAFRHALLQTAAEESMLRATRRATHRRIAQALQTRFPGRVEAEPETLAWHLTEGGLIAQAIAQWRRAGERALARSAVAEALANFDQGLALRGSLDDGPDADALELSLQIPRASALRAAQGVAAPDTGAAYQRAATLARRGNDTARLITALNGLYAYHMVRGQCDAARSPARQLLDVALERGDRMFEMIGHRAVGAVAFHLGEPRVAREHLERSLSLYDPATHAHLAVSFGIDHKVTATNFLSLTLFVLDQADAALANQHAGLAWAEALDHAHSNAQALVFTCLLMALREDWASMPALAERCVAVGQRHGFPLMEGGGRFFGGAARAFGEEGDPEAGLAAMQSGAALWWGTGARNYRALCELLMARVHAGLGRIDAAAGLLRAAHVGIAATGERWLEPELWRVEGELLRARDGHEATAARLSHALDLARTQQAALWERRALASLS